MNTLREAGAVIRAHWGARYGNIWAWMLPLAVIVCAIPPR